MIIVAPIAAMLIQMAVSRSREYKADEGGAKLLHETTFVASALGKLQAGAKQIPMRAQPSKCSSFHCQSVECKIIHETFQHASSNRGADRKIRSLSCRQKPLLKAKEILWIP